MCAFWDFKKENIHRDKKIQPFWFLGSIGQCQMVHFCLPASSITINSTIKEKTSEPNSVAQMLPEVSSDIREH